MGLAQQNPGERLLGHPHGVGVDRCGGGGVGQTVLEPVPQPAGQTRVDGRPRRPLAPQAPEEVVALRRPEGVGDGGRGGHGASLPDGCDVGSITMDLTGRGAGDTEVRGP